jgi:hypothetical protein
MSMITTAVLIGLFAAVYRGILSKEPVLSWWFAFGARWESKIWHKPIWGCEKCIAGQLCLWTYIANAVGKYHRFSVVIWNIVPQIKEFTPNLFGAGIFIATGILSAFVISFLITYIKNN